MINPQKCCEKCDKPEAEAMTIHPSDKESYTGKLRCAFCSCHAPKKGKECCSKCFKQGKKYKDGCFIICEDMDCQCHEAGEANTYTGKMIKIFPQEEKKVEVYMAKGRKEEDDFLGVVKQKEECKVDHGCILKRDGTSSPIVCNSSPSPLQDWEARFEKKYRYLEFNGEKIPSYEMNNAFLDNVKEFISSLLSAARSDVYREAAQLLSTELTKESVKRMMWSKASKEEQPK